MEKNNHFCIVHGKGKCIHSEYDYNFGEALSFGKFEVIDVKFSPGRYQNQNSPDKEVASLITREYGLINSGGKKSVESAKLLKNEIDRTGKPVTVHMEQINHGDRKPVCIVRF